MTVRILAFRWHVATKPFLTLRSETLRALSIRRTISHSRINESFEFHQSVDGTFRSQSADLCVARMLPNPLFKKEHLSYLLCSDSIHGWHNRGTNFLAELTMSRSTSRCCVKDCVRLLVAIAISLTFSHLVNAEISYRLDNHPDGNQGGDYGLRLDDSSVQTFNFDAASGTGVGVSLNFMTGNSTAEIVGKVLHNQSGELWSLKATLGNVRFTNLDGSDWRTNTSNGIYDSMLINLGNSGSPIGSNSDNDLKNPAFAADRIGFDSVLLELTFMDTGTATYQGPTTFYDFPNDGSSIPFAISKGFRKNSSGMGENDLAAAGWLNPVDPMTGTQTKGPTRDFLYKIGPARSPWRRLQYSRTCDDSDVWFGISSCWRPPSPKALGDATRHRQSSITNCVTIGCKPEVKGSPASSLCNLPRPLRGATNSIAS